ncbi:MAG: ankyrin repeat domain-containing protein [Magnetococcales bacterium]|nr:ankyrin repeat domain-containing protein [Magnetococcales bacterium]
MVKHLICFLAIITLTLSTTGYTKEKDIEQYLLLNLKRTMVDVNATDARGTTLLHWAAKNSYPRIVEFLLARGADPDRVNYSGITPIELAIESKGPGTGRIVQLLQNAILGKSTPVTKMDDSKTMEQSSAAAISSPATNNYSAFADKITLPPSTIIAQKIIKEKELEIDALNKKIADLKINLAKKDKDIVLTERNAKAIESISYELEDTKEKLKIIQAENQYLKAKTKSFKILDYLTVDFMLAIEWLNKEQ